MSLKVHDFLNCMDTQDIGVIEFGVKPVISTSELNAGDLQISIKGDIEESEIVMYSICKMRRVL